MGWATTAPHKMAKLTTVRELIATWEDNWSLLCGSNFCHVALVVEAIMTGTAITVSDGSYMPKMCTQLAMASWHIENPLTTLGCHGLAQVSGTEAETNAYQAELLGIHTILMALKVICDFHLIQHGSITINCDNAKASTCPAIPGSSPQFALSMWTSSGPSASWLPISRSKLPLPTSMVTKTMTTPMPN